MTKRKIESHESSGNVFADLGLPDSEERMLKAGLWSNYAGLSKSASLLR